MSHLTVLGSLILSAFISSFFIPLSAAQAAPKALVYKGPGACEEGCSEAAFEVAKLAGLDPVYVGPDAPDANTFKDAVVWLQPGGHASEMLEAMAPDLQEALRNFLQNGGGYVGFCAGAFVTTQKIGDTRNEGLNIFPGKTTLYGSGVDLKKINWQGHERYLYWEGGPFLSELPPSVETIATYESGEVAAARTAYGKGRVFITGLHPEASQKWRDASEIVDPDGTDFDLAVDMIHWAIEAH